MNQLAIKVTVNGSMKEFSEGTTILDIINQFKINQKNCLVELNLKTISREELNYQVKEGDVLELVRFIGGG